MPCTGDGGTGTGRRPIVRTLPSFDEAMMLVSRHVRPLGAESVATRDSCGRVTTQAIRARCDSPPFDTAAMDGHAIAQIDIAADRRDLAVGGDVAAGSIDHARNPSGIALTISTGARIPTGCDAVVARERASIVNGMLRLDDAVRPGANIRRRGEDAAAGDHIVDAGHRITPATLGALTSFGVEAVSVFRRPRFALFANGDELGTTIPDANGPMIAAAIAELGFDAPRPVRLRDDESAITEAIAAAVDADAPGIIVSTGGVSVGAHDHVAAALAALGATVHFHGVAMRPGKPVMFATLPNGSLYFGLPGNPVAALVGFRFFIVQAIRGMLGRAPEQGLVIAPPSAGKPGLTVFLKASSDVATGKVDILAGQESHKLRPLVSANCWVRIDPDGQARSYPASAAT